MYDLITRQKVAAREAATFWRCMRWCCCELGCLAMTQLDPLKWMERARDRKFRDPGIPVLAIFAVAPAAR